MKDRYIRLPEVMDFTGLSKPTIYRHIKLEIFPRPERIGVSAVAWRQSALTEWQEAREAAR